ncbi:MAG: type II toxin-antitoxin system HipA family toxin [Polyangiaceae bacterium]|nr:type II toxin-antitoxin system HipA family toxin [Polyangiaceae bacterium]
MSDARVFLGEAELGEILRSGSRGAERIGFRHFEAWLARPERFAIDPELFLDHRVTYPARGGLFGAFADSAPDRWGRQLMQRHERRSAKSLGRPVQTLSELDYLLGVADISRMGALRFWQNGAFVAESHVVPPWVRLRALLDASTRIARDEETDDDFSLIFAPGSSLGGARPKASVLDADGNLCIAKFPREGEEYSVERWERIALQLAQTSGISVPESRLLEVGASPVLLSRRFDRRGTDRIHFASAMTLLGLRDGDQASYPEIAEVFQREGSRPKHDSEELFRRMVFNICIANVDDHLRNHGFLRDPTGWRLSPAYDLNPVPADLKPRILSTCITPDDATGSLDAAREAAPYFGLRPQRVESIIAEVVAAVTDWERVARHFGAPKSELARMQSAFGVA